MTIRSFSLVLSVALATFSQASAQQITNLWVGDGPVRVSLATGEVVPDSSVTTENWHLVIDGVDVRPNGSGALLEASFDTVAEVPADGYTEHSFLSQTGQRWYHYDQDSHFIWAVPDRTLVAEFADGSVGKIEILSYYDIATEEPRYMTFRYARAEPGSRSF